MALKCIIVDDEPPAIRILEGYIAKTDTLERTAVFTDSLKALEFLNSNIVDVVFLDIQMPQLTGIQLSRIISKNINIIFTTAYPNFALEGFELNAKDYLLKPIAFERFCQAISKLAPPPISEEKKDHLDFLFIKTQGKNKYVKVNVDDILYITSLQNYICLHTHHKKIITYTSLKNILSALPEDFLQINKSHIVSLKQISNIDNLSVMIGDKELPIGNTYKDSFFEKIRKNANSIYNAE